jgi:maleate isomerase
LSEQTVRLSASPLASGAVAPLARASIGVITPSANVVVEQTTIRLLRAFPRVDANFSRVRVKGRADLSEDGYDLEGMLSAAGLLADAGPDILLWSGSKGVQFGVERDRDLCQRIEAATGIAATSPTLSLERLVRDRGIGAIGLISPYSRAYQTQLVEGFERMGVACVAEAHAGVDDNLAFASVSDGAIRTMARQVARARPDAILAWCTNFPAGPLAGALERELGIPFYDANSLGLWRALTILGVETTRAPSLWGAIFQRPKIVEPV